MRYTLFSGRLAPAIVSVVAALSGLISDCQAQSSSLQVVTTLELRLTAVRVQPAPAATPQTDELSEVPLPLEPKVRLEPPAPVLPAFEIFGGTTQIDGRPYNPFAHPPASADTGGAVGIGSGPVQTEGAVGFRWGGAVRQSMFFLAILHSVRMAAEPESRVGLRGPFFKDYFGTIKKLRGWRDGDTALVNYVAHPLQGAVSGFVQIHNDPKGPERLGFNRPYLNSRLKAMGWAAFFSTQFELGLISEASLGNVGLNPRDKAKNPMAFVDLVVTPIVGTAWLVGEDALDRYVISPLESRIANRLVRVLLRSFFNPGRSMSNMLRLKHPWHRDTRMLGP